MTTEIEYFENGQKKSEFNFINNLPVGNQILFYESGIKKTCEHINHKGDKIEIKTTKWYENSQIKEEGISCDGNKIGKHTKWYENGQIKEEVYYKNGKLID